MSVATLTKTASGVLLALTNVPSAAVQIGNSVDVSTKPGPATVFVKMGRNNATALTNEVLFRIEASAALSGNDEWTPIYTWTSQYGKTAANSTTLNGATTAGNTTTLLTSGTGYAAGASEIAYIKEATIANGEWSRVKSLSTNTVTWEEAQTRNHANGATITNYAETWAIPIDVSGMVRVRLVVDTNYAVSGQAVDVLGWIVTADSASIV